MFEFAYPWLFLLLPLPLLLRIFCPAARPQQNAALHVPFFVRLQNINAYSVQTRSVSRIGWLVASLIWLLLIISAAGPQWVGEPISLTRQGRSIFLVLDISNSMQIPDMEWNGQPVDRLTVVREVAKRFIHKRQGDRIGLVLFGSHAYLQTPLTFDRHTLRYMLDDATVGLAGPQTAIGEAIGLAVKHLGDSQQNNQVLILLTDGANNAGVLKPIQAAKIAAEHHIKIYSIGLGAQRMVMPGLLGPQLINPSADLDEDALKMIAKETRGAYYRARDTQALQDIYQKIETLEPIDIDEAIFRPIISYYYLFLALVLLMIFAVGLNRYLIMQNALKELSNAE